MPDKLADSTSSCDITALPPVPESRRLDASLREFEQRWHATARYKIYAKPPYTTELPPITIGRWYEYTKAKELAEYWSGRSYRTGWNDLHFGIELEMPCSLSATGGTAAVGDFLITPVQEDIANSLPCSTYRQFFLVGRVTATVAGQVTGFRDRRGEHVGCPKKAALAPTKQFDADAAARCLEANASAALMFGGEYDRPDAALRVMRPALLRGPAESVPDEEVEKLVIQYGRDWHEQLRNQSRLLLTSVPAPELSWAESLKAAKSAQDRHPVC